MTLPRALFVLTVLSVAAGLTLLLAAVLGAGGWTAGKALLLACFAGTAPWTGICFANAAFGLRVLAAPPAPAAASEPPQAAALPAVAIAVTVREEDMADVLPPLGRLLDGLDRAGAGAAFSLCILSDTADTGRAGAEAAAVARFGAGRPDGQVRYRRRAGNAGYKAGNLMEFLDRHADGFELALVLDADSEMSAAAVLRLLAAMRADPRLAIAQHLTVGRPAAAAFARLFQFGMRAGMRVWASGQDYWQGDAGPYWGHNALLRIAPFRAHARLPALPGGAAILSHDQVEAALLAGAGWGVRVVPVEHGSSEASPPALPDFIRRDNRWLAGNLQYLRLLRLPGLRWMGRWQLLQAVLLFAGAPLYLLLAAAAAAGAGRGSLPAAGVAAITLLWFLALHAPKLGGYAQVLLQPGLRAGYGGAARFGRGVAAELLFTLLLDPVMLASKSFAMLRLATGARAGWGAQNRAARGVGWGEAARLLWPHTLLGVLLLAGFAAGGVPALLWALPLLGGLALAIPFCVLTADPRLGRRLRAAGIAAVPEELAGLSPPPPAAVAPPSPPPAGSAAARR